MSVSEEKLPETHVDPITTSFNNMPAPSATSPRATPATPATATATTPATATATTPAMASPAIASTTTSATATATTPAMATPVKATRAAPAPASVKQLRHQLPSDPTYDPFDGGDKAPVEVDEGYYRNDLRSKLNETFNSHRFETLLIAKNRLLCQDYVTRLEQRIKAKGNYNQKREKERREASLTTAKSDIIKIRNRLKDICTELTELKLTEHVYATLVAQDRRTYVLDAESNQQELAGFINAKADELLHIYLNARSRQQPPTLARRDPPIEAARTAPIPTREQVVTWIEKCLKNGQRIGEIRYKSSILFQYFYYHGTMEKSDWPDFFKP
jgi:hypothetical protein